MSDTVRDVLLVFAVIAAAVGVYACVSAALHLHRMGRRSADLSALIARQYDLIELMKLDLHLDQVSREERSG